MGRSRRDAIRAVGPALGSALLGLLIGLAAATFGSASLFVPGIGLVVLGLGSAVWVTLAARGASVTRTLGPAVVLEEESYPIRLEMRAGVLPPPCGELREPLLTDSLPVAGRRLRRVRVDVTFARRGRRLLTPCRLLISDPLSLGRRELRSEPGEVLVLPRIEPLRTAGGGSLGASGARLGRQGVAAELEIDSLRPYREGAPASRIHWLTLARTGVMMERRLVAETDARPLVVLDPRGAADENDLDSAVRAAASLCFRLAQEEGCALLLPGERRPIEVAPDMRAWPALHVRLALVEAADGAPSTSRLERGGAAIFWVAASRSVRTPPALRRAAADLAYVVTPGASVEAELSVAGCTVRRLRPGKARAA